MKGLAYIHSAFCFVDNSHCRHVEMARGRRGRGRRARGDVGWGGGRGGGLEGDSGWGGGRGGRGPKGDMGWGRGGRERERRKE